MAFLVWILFFCLFEFGRPDIIEEEVLDEILYNYNKVARPATLENPKVTVKHGVNLIKIEQCDGKTLKALTWLLMSWTDPRLEWSLDYYDIKSLTLPPDLIWTPDIVLYNSPSSHAGNAYNPRVFVFNSGSISWYPPTHITTNCEESEIEQDTIFCYMRFGSWSYDGQALDIQPLSDFIDTEDFVENSEWEYINSSAVRNVKKYACCPEPYPDVTYNITLRRRQKPVEASLKINLPGSTNGGIENSQNGYQSSDTSSIEGKNITETHNSENDESSHKNTLNVNGGSDETGKSGK